MTVKTKTPAEPTPLLSYAAVARKRLRQRLTDYRSLVEAAVAGKQLTEDQLGNIYDILSGIGLPSFAFERDVEGVKQHARSLAKWTEYQQRELTDRERQRVVGGEIKALTEQLNSLKAEAHRLSTSLPLKAAGACQRVNELKALHPQVLLDLDDAVDVRAQALKLDVPSPEAANAGRLS